MFSEGIFDDSKGVIVQQLLGPSLLDLVEEGHYFVPLSPVQVCLVARSLVSCHLQTMIAELAQLVPFSRLGAWRHKA